MLVSVFITLVSVLLVQVEDSDAQLAQNALLPLQTLKAIPEALLLTLLGINIQPPSDDLIIIIPGGDFIQLPDGTIIPVGPDGTAVLPDGSVIQVNRDMLRAARQMKLKSDF